MSMLHARDVTKRFGGTIALNHVDFAVESGEVHGLVGANGAGKSTLIKLLSGVLVPDEGAILLDGKAVAWKTPADAIADGIEAVHQEANVCPHLTVLENLFLGRELRSQWGLIDQASQTRLAQEALARIGLPPSVLSAFAGQLSVAMKQLVLIARALVRRAKVVIFDEPTATITADEAGRLFRAIEQLRDTGTAVIYISHRLEEVFSLADRITVLRDGNIVGSSPAADLSVEDVVHLMIKNAPTGSPTRVGTRTDAEAVLEVHELSSEGKFAQVSFSVHAGQILGLFGLVGSGAFELLRALFGDHPISGGAVVLSGQPYLPKEPADAIRRGVALVPEDRRYDGNFLGRALRENVTCAVLDRFTQGALWLRLAEEDRSVLQWIQSLGIVAASKHTEIQQLSGGNQQKALLGRWLATDPRVLLLCEPTRGVDVGAKSEIWQRIRLAAQQGMAVLVASTDLQELHQVDLVGVMRRGQFFGPYEAAAVSSEELLSMALGGRASANVQ